MLQVINLHEILYGLKKFAKSIREIFLLPVIEYTKRDVQLFADLKSTSEELTL
ncbi:MAG: hypothetical protein NZ922_04020 [Candidatus Methanomethyliaceae archaeon]|nr:hypothetical protein [Candidatus Methanomethyliaceae archaeon]MDW7970641.1 hypothetical protein [Nitrososphaerota archaeon]